MAEPLTLLIDSNRAGAMKVHGRDGDAIGQIHAFMIHKRSGAVPFVVVSVGGFLGMGTGFYPVPFELLAYDPRGDFYTITVDRRLLEGGPSWSSSAPLFDQAYADRVTSYYGGRREDVGLG